MRSVSQFFGFARDPSRAEKTGFVSYTQGDATKATDITAFIETVRPTHILNLLGLFRGDFEKLMAVNVMASRTLCETALRPGMTVKRIVLTGSAAEYGLNAINPVQEDATLQPVSNYGLAKVCQSVLANYYFRNFMLPTIVARTFNISGEGLSPELSLGNFARQIQALANGGSIKVGNLSTSRDFLPIMEVCRRYWVLLMKGVPGEVYNICSGKPVTMRAMLDKMILESGKSVAVETDPALFKDNDAACIYGDGSKFAALET